MVLTISEALKEEYPFPSNFFKLSSGEKAHYIDCGEGPVTILLHGNPTWSFFYRNVIKGLMSKGRVIALDHIGCGLSDKPQEYEYTLQQHIDNFTQLVEGLGIESFNLIVHDWGGAIGMGYAVHHSSKIDKLILLNTAAFTSKTIPPSINFCRTPFIGELVIRLFNGFAWPATKMAVTKKMPDIIKEGFLFPYNNYKTRIATARFVQDIPLDKSHPSFKTLLDIENNLSNLKCEKLILWGGKDFCFNDSFYHRWKEIYPEAKTKYLEEAGHYLLEDSPEECLEEIEQFLH